MHPSLEQLEKCLPVFRRVDNQIRALGISAPLELRSHKSNDGHPHFGIEHRAQTIARVLRWRVRYTTDPNEHINGRFAAIDVDLLPRIGSGQVTTLYRLTTRTWDAYQAGNFKQEVPKAIAELAETSRSTGGPSQMNDDEALALIHAMAKLFLEP